MWWFFAIHWHESAICAHVSPYPEPHFYINCWIPIPSGWYEENQMTPAHAEMCYKRTQGLKNLSYLLSILTQYPYYQIFPLLMREILYLPRLFAIQPWKDSSEQWMVSVLLRICAGTWWSHRGLLPNRVHLENDLLHQPLPDDQLVVSDTDPGESSCSTYATYCVLHN